MDPTIQHRGFRSPENCRSPRVAGPGKLARFKNAQELHDFILASMPWWNPGHLTDEESWQVSAYILQLHKVMPEEFELKRYQRLGHHNAIRGPATGQ